MTAATATRLTLLGNCYKTWCLGAYGCTKEDPGSLRLHEGRSSSVRGTFDATLWVSPLEFDEQDGTPYSGPLIQITVDENARNVVELTPDAACDFAAALAEFAAGHVPVGETASFAGSCTADKPAGTTLTLRRLDDVTFEYGDVGPRYMTFGAVELAFNCPDDDPIHASIGLDAPTAAAFARFVTAVACEVTQ